MTKGAGGSFQFTGGELHADYVNFPLVNNGGTLAPGHSVGTTHVEGDLTLNSGVLEIEIGGRTFGQFDRVEVNGVAHLGGMLRVKLVDLGGGTYAPQLGDAIPFLSSAGTGGAFAVAGFADAGAGTGVGIAPGNVATFLTVVALVELAMRPTSTMTGSSTTPTCSPGGRASAWRAKPSNANGDADGDGDVDGRDLLVWQQQLGAAGQAASVPEPSSLAVTTVAGLAIIARRRLEYNVKVTGLR